MINTLSDEDALRYSGGFKITVGIGAAITATISFVLGLIDGITNPQKCNVIR